MNKSWLEPQYCTRCGKTLSSYEYYVYKGLCTQCLTKERNNNE